MKKRIFLLLPIIIIGLTIKLVQNTLYNKTNAIAGVQLNQDSQVVNADATNATIEKTQDIASSSQSISIATETKKAKQEITEYTVQPGDVIGSIAQKFGISTNTMLQTNNLSANSLIKPGDKLTILPVDGVLYTVKNGDTISKIASIYNADEKKIAEENNLANNNTISIGQNLIIPGGNIAVASQATKTTTAKTTTTVTSIKTQTTTTNSLGITWTASALNELNKVPSFVRPTIKRKVNAYASSHNIRVITKGIYDSIKV